MPEPLLPPSRRPDPRRTELGRYPFSVDLQTRWGDMDMLRHLNNSALTRYYEEARVRFSQVMRDRLAGHLPGLVAAVTVDYLDVAHWPEPLTAGIGVADIGRSSWRLAQALFQQGRCVGLADVTLVHMGADRSRPTPVPDQWRAMLQELQVDGS